MSAKFQIVTAKVNAYLANVRVREAIKVNTARKLIVRIQIARDMAFVPRMVFAFAKKDGQVSVN